jgi:uncharacterized membrane protein
VCRVLIAIAEILLFSALILASRCANFREVFVGGDVYFTDADCYSRMTRARICLEDPGTILRHHSFENFPAGTTPHTTAPLDYLLAGLAAALKPFTSRALDMAGAIASPILGLTTGWFLWWWSRRARIRHRFALLLLYAASPILAHATQLGRPDHQALLLALMAFALCAEFSLINESSRRWSVVSGCSWGLALWVSLYEPLILLGAVALAQLLIARKSFTASHRIPGWIVLGVIVLVAFAVERRMPEWPRNSELFFNWARTIGELSPVPISDPVWLRWAGLLILAAPALFWIAVAKRRALPVFLAAALCVTFALTVWQARWACFFVLMFSLALPFLLELVANRLAAGVIAVVSLYPILQDWDERIWPSEERQALLNEQRVERVAFREIARGIDGPFLAPWWWSPALAYWTGQPGTGGSSHEALDGIERSARLYLAADPAQARAILQETRVKWVVAYDAGRVLANSAELLGVPVPQNALGQVLDRAPSQAPPDFQLAAQNSAAKLFLVRFFREK